MLFLSILLFIHQIYNCGRTCATVAGSMNNLDLLPDECAQINGNRITGGTTANLYEFPWMALVSYNTSTGLKFVCAGSIINSRYILTSAHCVIHKEKVAGVRVGEYDLSSQIDCQEKDGQTTCEQHLQDIQVEEIIVHENYATPKLSIPDNDIALLRVQKEINFNHQNVGKICLPRTLELRNSNIVGKIGTVTGWQPTRRYLLKRDMVIISDIECQNRYQHKNTIINSTICVDTPDKDNSIGDGGAPLMVQDEYEGATKYIQYGIVSGGSTKYPLINTDVRKYMDWIIDHLKP